MRRPWLGQTEAAPRERRPLQYAHEGSETMANGKGGMQWLLDVLKTLLPSIVLAMIGYYLNDTVNHALHARELQLEAVKAMELLAPAIANAASLWGDTVTRPLSAIPSESKIPDSTMFFQKSSKSSA